MAKPLDGKRAQVIRLQRNAGKKISRNKSANGTIIAGSEFDPRKALDDISKMRGRDLDAQIRRLTRFNSRDTQFVAGHGGVPLPRTDWRAYEAAQNGLNAKKKREHDSVKDIALPHGDETIGQRTAKMTPDHAGAGNPAVNPFRPLTRQPSNITGTAKLKELTKKLRKQQGSKWDAEEYKATQAIYKAMVARIGAPELADAIGALSPKKFMLMWHYTKFAEDLSRWYHVVKELVDDGEKEWYDDSIADAFESVWDHVNWAKKLK
jgi:hypothetical protein